VTWKTKRHWRAQYFAMLSMVAHWQVIAEDLHEAMERNHNLHFCEVRCRWCQAMEQYAEAVNEEDGSET